jgi:hypothetical protein
LKRVQVRGGGAPESGMLVEITCRKTALHRGNEKLRFFSIFFSWVSEFRIIRKGATYKVLEKRLSKAFVRKK